MMNKPILGVILSAMLLAACDSGMRDPQGVPPVQPPLPPPSPPDQGAWSATTWHYLGLMWGSSAGPYRIFSAAYGCDPPANLAIEIPGGGACVDYLSMDGIPQPDSSRLRSGQVVELYKSSIDETPGVHGYGTWIDIRRSVVGSIASIDEEHLRMTVLGQQVHITGETNFVGFADIAVGDVVSVSGHFSADGNIIATLIEREPLPGPQVLRGILVAEPGGQFRIGGQLVDLSAATYEKFPGGTPLPGDAVLVFADQEPQGGVLVVQAARFTGESWDPRGAENFEVNGFITATNGLFDFDIAGHSFYYSTWDCLSCNRLAELSRSVAVGTFVRFAKPPSSSIDLQLGSVGWDSMQLTGKIDSIDPQGESFTIAGMAVQTNPASHISADDDLWVGSAMLRVAELGIGNSVTVSGDLRPRAGADRALEYDDGVLVAGSVIPAGEGMQIHTQSYKRADPEIIFLGRSILTDAATTVTACDNAGHCFDATPAWLFANDDYFQPVLTIDVDPDAVPLRAIHIRAERDY